MSDDKYAKIAKWKAGVDNPKDKARWDKWDTVIDTVVSKYNNHLKSTPRYVYLTSRIVKAMAWVETGGDHKEWDIKPLQIGVPGDPGMNAILSVSGDEGGSLILPKDIKAKLNAETVRTSAEMNIYAGVGYLLMRLANTSMKSVPDTGSKVYEVTIKPGDNLYRIAKNEGSTEEMLKTLNPGVAILKPGNKVKCQKASMQRVITGWRTINSQTIHDRYNGRGDPNYNLKLEYALEVICKRSSALCAS